jgi:hypothetical protein
MMGRALLCLLCAATAACGGLEDSKGESAAMRTARQQLALFDYEASETDTATNPKTSANSFVDLYAGEAVMIGTCGITDSYPWGETVLRLFQPKGQEVASSDHACNGDGSKISYTPLVSDSYLLRAGCFLDNYCSGTVAISRRKGVPAPFRAANTHNALVNTYNKQYSFRGGDVVRISTCGYNATGASASGDTYLRLYQNNGGVFTQVAENNSAEQSQDFCSIAAEIVYTIPSAGYYQVRVGCDSNKSCSGALAVYVE